MLLFGFDWGLGARQTSLSSGLGGAGARDLDMIAAGGVVGFVYEPPPEVAVSGRH